MERPVSKTHKTMPAVLPGQVMASVEELKKKLEESRENSNLSINILTSLIYKLPVESRPQYLKQKIELLIEENSLAEARTDMQALLELEMNEENRLLYCRLLLKQKEFLDCMTQLLRLRNVNCSDVFERNVEELASTDFFDSLFIIPNLPDLYSSQITFFPELRGKVVLQICSSSSLTYILISTCPHLAQKIECPLGLYNCCEELQLLEVSNSILSPIDFLTNQKLSMVSCSDLITGVLHRTGRITLWGELPDNKTHLILEHPCQQILVGSTFICLLNDDSINFWGKMGNLNTITEDYTNIVHLSSLSGQLACSDNHLSLLNEGCVYTLGTGEEGQLGLGEEIMSIDRFEQCEIPHVVKQVLCNNEVTVALTREAIYAWGLINPLQLHNMPPISWKPIILDSFDVEHIAATLSKFEMLVLGKDQYLYSWIWKEDTKLKKYRKLDICGICTLSLRGSEAFLVKKIAIPQLTQIIDYPNKAYSGVPFALTLTLYDQYGPSFVPGAEVTLAFNKQKSEMRNEMEYNLTLTDDDDGNSVALVTVKGFGEYWMHIFVDKQRVLSSPVKISILPSPSQEVILTQLEYIKKLQAFIEDKKAERVRIRREYKEKAVEERENKLERTRKRAQEALRNYLDNKEKELIRKENERIQKIKNKVGGGYVIPY